MEYFLFLLRKEEIHLDHNTGGKVIIDIQMLFRLQPGKGFAYGKLLLVTSAGSKPIFLCFRHLKVI